jgi:hypothetical protein
MIAGGKAMDGAFCRWASIARQPGGMRQLLRSATGYDGRDKGGQAWRSGEAKGHAFRPPSQQETLLPAAGSSFTLDYTFDRQLAPLRQEAVGHAATMLVFVLGADISA